MHAEFWRLLFSHVSLLSARLAQRPALCGPSIQAQHQPQYLISDHNDHLQPTAVGKEKNTLPPWYWYCVLRMGATESTVLGGSRASGPHACGPVDAAAGQGLECAHDGITRKPACAQPSQRGPLAHEPENGKAAVRRRGGVAVGEAGMRAGDR